MQKGLLPHLHSELCLPPLTSIMQGNWRRSVWKKQVRSATLSAEFLQFLEVCDHLPLSNCLLSVGKPARHWHSTLGLPALTRLNNFRIRLLVGCDGLEADASRFHYRHLPSIPLCQISAASVNLGVKTQLISLPTAADCLPQENFFY